MSRYVGEFLGAFALIFAGTGAIIVNDVSGGVIGHAGIALTFGLIVMTMIYAVGNLEQVWIYLIAPFIGACLAILSCRLMRTADCCIVLDPEDRCSEESWGNVSANP